MTTRGDSKPLSISTKIPIYWLLTITLALGSWQATERVSNATYREANNLRVSKAEQDMKTLEEKLDELHGMVSRSCLDVAIMQNNQQHIIELMEDMKQNIERLHNGIRP